MRTVVDKQQQNANTHKLAAPLPDIEDILRNVVKHKYRSIIDGKDAYEQIRVIPEHVPRTLFTTPDGTMVSLVLQQGDVNGPTTYQTVMNHIFAPYIGVFMDVYLDDIALSLNFDQPNSGAGDACFSTDIVSTRSSGDSPRTKCNPSAGKDPVQGNAGS